jgi:hypothetical protein
MSRVVVSWADLPHHRRHAHTLCAWRGLRGTAMPLELQTDPEQPPRAVLKRGIPRERPSQFLLPAIECVLVEFPLSGRLFVAGPSHSCECMVGQTENAHDRRPTDILRVPRDTDRGTPAR